VPCKLNRLALNDVGRRVNSQAKGTRNQEEKSDGGGERFHDGMSECEEFTLN